MEGGDGQSGSEPGEGAVGGGDSANSASSEAASDRSDRSWDVDLGRKIERLHEVATEIQTATAPGEIYELTIEAAADILGFDVCVVQIATEGYFEIAAASDNAPVAVGDRPITSDHGITGHVYRTGESTVIADVHAHPIAEPTVEEFRSGLTVPLGNRGVFQGVATEKGFFDEDDLELAELLLSHTMGALARVEKMQRLDELNDATRELMAAETHEAVAQQGCEIAASILDRPLAAIFYADEGGDALVPMAGTDPANEVFDGNEPIERGMNQAWTAFAENRTLVWQGDVETRGTDGSTVEATGSPTWEHLATSLGEHGVLRVSSPAQGRFDGSDMTLAETLAANIEAAFTRADREQNRREQARRLRRQNERLDRFASIVSHDLRNPLNVAMTRAELARRDDDNDHFQHVENALDRMERIIEKTLSLARQGQTVDATEPVSLRRVAEESWSGVETSGWHLDVVDDTTIYADSDRLRNVFENLYRNAVEHGSTSSDSQAPLRVRVGVLDDGFYVEDTGVGIPPDEREQVFELGYSADAEGTGFGLAIVREIVEAHGWDIGVTESNDVSPEEHRESGAGEMSSPGTRFEITGVKSE